jgi:uncharacterized protein (TIGR02466 family)
MSDVQFLNPFGTLLIKNRVPDPVFAEIQKLVEQVRPNLNDQEFVNKTSFSNYLAGKNKFQIILPDRFLEVTGFGEYLIGLSKIFVQQFNYSDQHLKLGNAWLNFTYAGDFNSVHTHDSLLSGVVYIKQDQAIFNEAAVETNIRAQGSLPGGTNFIYDLNVDRTFTRSNYVNNFVEQEVILFPSWLTHYVNPFRCDAERITLAFNIIEDK